MLPYGELVVGFATRLRRAKPPAYGYPTTATAASKAARLRLAKPPYYGYPTTATAASKAALLRLPDYY
ncbi:MAG: hypothetical protein ACUVWZ_16150 [Anaerolineae bacterium]